MIKLIGTGDFQILQTPAKHRLIILGRREYGWTKMPGIGEMLVVTKKPKSETKLLKRGRFRIYKVKDESYLIDNWHLELLSTKRSWEAFLLPMGLPYSRAKQTPIEATPEVISSSRG